MPYTISNSSDALMRLLSVYDVYDDHSMYGYTLGKNVTMKRRVADPPSLSTRGASRILAVPHFAIHGHG